MLQIKAVSRICCPFPVYNSVIYPSPTKISRDAPTPAQKINTVPVALPVLSFSDCAYGITKKSYQIIWLNSEAVCNFVCPTLISLTEHWNTNHEFSFITSPLSLWIAFISPHHILGLCNCFRRLIFGGLSLRPLVGPLPRKKSHWHHGCRTAWELELMCPSGFWMDMGRSH